MKINNKVVVLVVRLVAVLGAGENCPQGQGLVGPTRDRAGPADGPVLRLGFQTEV